MKKMVIIGGGENGRILEGGSKAPYNTYEIDKRIVELSGKKNPNFLFINHAMESIDIQNSYFETMKKIYGDIFNCNCLNLLTTELDDMKKVMDKINLADIIYEGGGDTTYMIELWKKSGFDKVLYDAYNSGKVITGISAGAVCYFNSCNSDTENGIFDVVDCLNWFDYFITPHCNEEGRMESTKMQLKDCGKTGILLSNCCGIEVVDKKYRVILSSENAYALKSFWENDNYIISKLDSSGDIDNI